MPPSQKFTTVVQPGGRIEVFAPDFHTGQAVDLTVSPAIAESNGRRSILEILAECPGHLLFQSADDVDATIRAERDAWDR